MISLTEGLYYLIILVGIWGSVALCFVLALIEWEDCKKYHNNKGFLGQGQKVVALLSCLGIFLTLVAILVTLIVFGVE